MNSIGATTLTEASHRESKISGKMPRQKALGSFSPLSSFLLVLQASLPTLTSSTVHLKAEVSGKSSRERSALRLS